MNINPLLQQAEGVLGVPVYPSAADVSAPGDNYIVYEYLDERVQLYGDDTDAYDMTNIRVHWFMVSGVQDAKRRLRKFLRSVGFTIVSTSEDYEENTNLHHISVDADIGGYINDEEDG